MEKELKFTQIQIKEMGATFYWNGQAWPVNCVACKEGLVDFVPSGSPVFGIVQIYRMTCEKCGKTGIHPN